MMGNAEIYRNARRGAIRLRALKKIAAALTITILFLTTIALVGLIAFYHRYADELPSLERFANYNPSLVTKIYDSKDRLIAEYFIERRILTPIAKIPQLLIDVTLAVEDASFYDHHGINLRGIARAMKRNLFAGRIVEGGSSITQQVAKLLFFKPERTFERKIKEIITAIKLDRRFSKDEILDVYLNQIYYGHGAYGIKAAALVYFGAKLDELTLSQAALLAGLPKAPNIYSPYNDLGKAMMRRRIVLARALDEGYIDEKTFREAAEEPIELIGLTDATDSAPWFTEHVRRILESQFGAENLYKGGLVARTTLDLEYQLSANKAVRSGLEAADRRLGYRGPLFKVDLKKNEPLDWKEIEKRIRTARPKADELGRLTLDRFGLVERVEKGRALLRLADGRQAQVSLEDSRGAYRFDPEIDAGRRADLEDMRASFAVGDLIEIELLDDGASPRARIRQRPDLQGALIALENSTGAIRAMIGGYDSDISQFNRASQASRQPGSAFKPIIYAAALSSGLNPSTKLIDSPLVYDPARDQFMGWKPMNFDRKFHGPTTIREALVHSRNVIAIRALEEIGARKGVEFARRLGIKSGLEANLGLALGVSPVRLIELTSAYSTIANRGVRREPFTIRSVEDADGKMLFSHQLPKSADEPRALDPGVAYILLDILKEVTTRGTATIVGREIPTPVAGKTGTTNDYQDAWFIGATPDLCVGVWVGRDDNSPIGRNETGGRIAAPIWVEFAKSAFANRARKDFPAPDNVIFARVNAAATALTYAGAPGAKIELFLEGREPSAIESPDAPRKIERTIADTDL